MRTKLPKRNPAPWEYFDLNGRLRTSKGRLANWEAKKLQALKVARFEEKMSKRKLKDLVKIYEEKSISKPALAILIAKIEENEIAWASRGHRMTKRFRKKGLFIMLLTKLEESEKIIIKKYGFEEYKKLLANSFSQEWKVSPEIKHFLLKMPVPMHVDYTKTPQVGVVLIKCGYSLAEPSLRKLQKLGLNTNEIPPAEFFSNSKLREFDEPLFFVKPMRIE